MRTLLLRITLVTVVFAIPFTLSAQITPPGPPFASDLLAPTKIIFTPRGNLVVAEAGNGPNTGRITFIDRLSGEKRAIISGLPSAINTLGGEPAPSGPSGIDIEGSVLYVTIGGGDSAVPGPVSGSEQLNNNPSSQLFSSVLAIDLGGPIENIEGGFALSGSDQATLFNHEPVELGSGLNSVRVRLITNFPDYRFEPRPDFSGNIRSSNPFGVVARGDTLYVADASWNSIRTVNVVTGATSTLATIPQINNSTSLGPPTIDAVPDSIHLFNGNLLVTTLTGFPFPPGAARVYTIDPNNGTLTLSFVGLTSAIDSASFTNGSGGTSTLLLEFSMNQLSSAPGALLLEGAAQDTTVVSGLITPTSMAFDSRSGDVFITEIFPGLVVKANLTGLVPRPLPPSIVPVVASTPGVGGSDFDTAIQLTNPFDFPIAGSLVIRSASSSDDDPTATYSLAAHETASYSTLNGLIAFNGVGSMDVIPTIGPAPTIVTRVYEKGSGNSFYEDAVGASSIFSSGEKGLLIGPSSTTQFRMNIGVRTFEAGANLRFIVYHANGTQGTAVEMHFDPNTLTQLPAGTLLGADLQASDSIVVQVLTGSAIVYGSVVNNETQASSLQFAQPFSN